MSEAILTRGGNVTKSYVNAQDDLKVDKVEGKGLSTNDFTDEYKDKLDNLGDSLDFDASLLDFDTEEIVLESFISNNSAAAVVGRSVLGQMILD